MEFKLDRCVTLAKDVGIAGIGLHSGVGAEVVLRPHTGGGVVLRRGDVSGGEFRLKADMVQKSPLCTLLDNGEGVSLSTVEHLLSALHGLRVDSVIVEINGPEVPILDGSALPWVELIDKAGRIELEGRERNWLRVAKPVVADMEGRVLLANPDARTGLRVECSIDFPHASIGKQLWKGVVDEQVFRREIAPARTFVQEKDIAAAQAAGLAKGGSLENALVYGENGGVLNKDGLRFADEPVRHKVLDLIGDIYMEGRCVSGALAVTAPGHVANNQLLRKIVAVEGE